MSQLLEKLLPILFIMLLGVILRKTKIIGQEAMIGIKNIILKVGLPAVLFLAFAQAKIESAYIYLFGIVFMMCLVLYVIGNGCNRFFPKIYDSGYTGGYFTGFEFGMLGIGLFSALWGTDKLPMILMIGFGHEIFIWFFYVPLLEYKKTGQINMAKIIGSFMKSPIIIAILSGILVNMMNAYNVLEQYFVGRSFVKSLDLLSNIVSPLILIVIGYGMTLKKIPIKKAMGYIIGRWIVVLIVGGLALSLVLSILPQQDPFFIKAFFAFLILPPPFILPLFIREEAKEEQSFFSDLLIYHTLTSFIGFVVLMII